MQGKTNGKERLMCNLTLRGFYNSTTQVLYDTQIYNYTMPQWFSMAPIIRLMATTPLRGYSEIDTSPSICSYDSYKKKSMSTAEHSIIDNVRHLHKGGQQG